MISFYKVLKNWLNRYDESSLTDLDIYLLKLILKRIIEGKFSEADRIIEYLKSYQDTLGGKYAYEKGEVWTEFALAYYLMKYPYKAVKSLNMAEKLYPKESHQHAVVRWMLGIIQWEIENEIANALINWNGAIEEFSLLKRVAEEYESEEKNIAMRNDWKEKKDWYFGRVKGMKVKLRKKILEKFP